MRKNTSTPRDIQEPVREVESGSMGGTKVTHPAFGTISASRVSGHAALFGSRVKQQGYMKITIHPATLYEDTHGHDRIHGSIETLMEVEMTEAQWVAFISRPNIGTGSPCTLRYRPTGLTRCPELPDPELARERFHRIADEVTEKARREAAEAAERLRELCAKLPQKVQQEVGWLLGRLASSNESSFKFANTTLHEKVEDVITEAKTEIEATVAAITHGLGVSSLQELVQLAAERGVGPGASQITHDEDADHDH